MIITYILSIIFLLLGATELMNLLPEYGFSFEPIRNALLWSIGLVIFISSTISAKPKLLVQKICGLVTLIVFLLDTAALFNFTPGGFRLLPIANLPQMFHLALFGLTSTALLIISFLPKQKNPIVMGS